VIRSRLLLGTILLVTIAALLAIATCHDERAVVSDSGSDADPPRGRVAAPAAVPHLARARAVPPAPPEAVPLVIEEGWFHEPVARWETEKRIDVTGTQPGALVAKWIAMSDSGIELERRSAGKALWRVHVEPLGIDHSKYHQDVTVRVEGDRVVVESVGAQKILEIRDLATGARTLREVTEVAR
jgi:hypothetical protein